MLEISLLFPSVHPLFSAFLASPIPQSLFAPAKQATELIVQYIQDSLYQNRAGQDLGFVYHKVKGGESGNLSTCHEKGTTESVNGIRADQGTDCNT